MDVPEKNPLKLPGLPDKLKVTERKMTMKEIVKASGDGTLKEMFGSGTAAVVSPVESIGCVAMQPATSRRRLTAAHSYEGKKVPVPVGSDGLGDVARAMLRQLNGIQLGEIESDWAVLVD
jgi:branched-chain amino acid aminotransferase